MAPSYASVCLTFTPSVSLFQCLKLYALAALFAAQRFFSAKTMAALPAALSLRFGLVALVAAGLGPALLAAHRFLWASAIALRAAALIFRLPCFARVGASGVSSGSPFNIARSSAI